MSQRSTRKKTVVAHVVDALDVGGAERMAVDMANLGMSDGLDTHLVMTRRRGPLESDLRHDVSRVCLGRRRTWDPQGLIRLARFARGSGVSVLHSHGQSSMRLVSFCIGAGLVSSAHLFHDHIPAGNSISAATRAAALLGIDAYVTPDQQRFEQFGRTLGLDPGLAEVVRNGVSMERFAGAGEAAIRSEYEVPADRLIGVCVGNLRPQKDHPLLLRALAQSRAIDQVTIVLVGAAQDRNYAEQCRSLVSTLGLRDSIRFAGSRSDIPAFLAAADFGVLSSCRESGPLAVAEYLAAGLPVVTTDVGEVVHSLPPELSEFVVPPGDVGRLADALTRVVLNRPAMREELGRLGRRHAHDHLSQEQAWKSIGKIYETVLDRSRVTGPYGRTVRAATRRRTSNKPPQVHDPQ